MAGESSITARVQIRLLHLLPGQESDPLECSLETVTPFEEPNIETLVNNESHPTRRLLPYEAISYAWGNVNSEETIVCNGKLLSITSSLAAALRRMRRRIGPPRVLWADGICINQKNDSEKEQQVPLMAAIYSQAKQVLCWLGEDDEGHAACTFGLADTLWTRVQPRFQQTQREQIQKIVYKVLPTLEVPQKIPPETPSELAESANWITGFFLDFDELDEEIQDASNAVHFVELFKKSWFHRMWIRQEIGWATKATVLCGRWQTDWRSLFVAHLWARSRAFKNHKLEWHHTVNMGFDNFNESRSTLQLLVSSRRFQCTNPKDRVFALLAHPSAYIEETHPGFKDYVAPVLKSKSRGQSDSTIAKQIAEARETIRQDYWSLTLEKEPELRRMHLEPKGQREKLDSETMVFFHHILHMMNEIRRLNEIENLRLHAVNRVYPMSFITCGMSKRAVKVDYSRSLDEIYTDIAIHVIRSSKSWDILREVQHDENPGSACPSWVPRWDTPEIYYGLNRVDRQFRAWTWPTSYTFTGKVNRTRFTAPAVLVGKITFSMDPCLEEPLLFMEEPMDLSKATQIWKTIISHDSSSSRQLTQMERLQMFQRTLTAESSMVVDGFRTDILDDLTGNGWNRFAAFWTRMYRYDQAYGGGAPGPELPYFPELEDAAESGSCHEFISMAAEVCRNRHVFFTDNGYFGIGPKILQEGDLVFILPQPVPFVLRRQRNHYILAGECYVDGVMKGEMMKGANVETIEIH